eukprot:Sdes_comp10707_c0_seq1m2393
MIEQFNRIALFVETCILKWDTPSMRARIIARFVQIAERLREYNNFNSLKAVLSGLQSTPIFRLHKTWSQVGSKRKRQLREMTTLMSEESNYKFYREILEKTQRSGESWIPYLGVHLTDLAFLDYVNQEKKQKNIDLDGGSIGKDNSIPKVLSTIHQLLGGQGSLKYPFTSKPIIRYYLLNVHFDTEEESYQNSLHL